MKVYLHSIGCRLNHSEIETMARQLTAAGHEIVAHAAEADKIVINTCAVTRQASRDARHLTRRIHRQNDTAEIFLTGCYTTIAPHELTALPAALVPNRQKAQLVRHLDPTIDPDQPLFEQEPLVREFRATPLSHTRAFVKVQDGCNNKCTFCVTTLARGAEQSRPISEVVAEIQTLTAAGYREAVLTGVHLGGYGRDLGHTLRDLVQAILTQTPIPRLRLSSLEPWDLPDDFFHLWHNPRLLPHLHLPLQSGSDRILQRMARRTKQASFRALVTAARAHIPHLNLTTDIIVGFPGESEVDFQQTLDFVAEIRFSRLHVFPYSVRPGTAAARFAGQLPKTIKKERVQRVLGLAQQLGEAFHRPYIGQTVAVLWESAMGADETGLRLRGYTDNYMRVVAHAPADWINRVQPVTITAADADGLTGRREAEG